MAGDFVVAMMATKGAVPKDASRVINLLKEEASKAGKQLVVKTIDRDYLICKAVEREDVKLVKSIMKGGMSGYIKARDDVLKDIDALVAWWDGSSKGVGESIEIAKERGIPVTVIEVEKVKQKDLFGGDAKKVDKKGATIHGYNKWECISALQKAIRRSDGRRAMFFAWELCVSGYSYDAWRRLRVIAAEDCAGIGMVAGVEALRRAAASGGEKEEFWAARAAWELAKAPKDRTPDDFVNWAEMQAKKGANFRRDLFPLMDWDLDMHTRQGKAKGRGYMFFLEESSKLEGDTSSYDETYKNEVIEALKRGWKP